MFAAGNVFAGLLPTYAPFVALPFLLVAGVAWFNAYRRRRLLDQQSDIESIRNLSWQDFELLVGEAFRRQGYAVEENGGGGADGGVDLRLRRDGKTYIVQCKRWKSRQVGVSPVRELYGLMMAENAAGAFFVTSGVFTNDAVQFAAESGMSLLGGAAISKLVRESQPLAGPGSAGARATSPTCPRCGEAMVLRTAKRGQHVGENFWGCASYPKCAGLTRGFGVESLIPRDQMRN